MPVKKMIEKLNYIHDVLQREPTAPVTYADLAMILHAGLEGEPRKKFVPPSLDAVKAYCAARQNNVDPEEFLNHYETNGWMRGKTPVKDWQACVRTWEKNAGFKQSPGFRSDQSMFEQEEGKL